VARAFVKLLIPLALVLAGVGCAGKEPPFDPVAVFREAEDNMHKESFEKARKGYQEIQEKTPDKSYDAVLMLRIADTYFGEEKYAEALVEYRNFLNYHPVHKDAPYAQYQVAMCSYDDLTATDRDPTPAHTVIKEMGALTEKYPRSGYEDQAQKYVAICRDWVADYEFYVGRFYYKKDSYRAAAGRFDKLLEEYPDSTADKDALYYSGLSHRELGEKDLARARFETLAQKYPAMKAKAAELLRTVRTP
jgi:outer membrane protein assembly factor BamD